MGAERVFHRCDNGFYSASILKTTMKMDQFEFPGKRNPVDHTNVLKPPFHLARHATPYVALKTV